MTFAGWLPTGGVADRTVGPLTRLVSKCLVTAMVTAATERLSGRQVLQEEAPLQDKM